MTIYEYKVTSDGNFSCKKLEGTVGNDICILSVDASFDYVKMLNMGKVLGYSGSDIYIMYAYIRDDSLAKTKFASYLWNCIDEEKIRHEGINTKCYKLITALQGGERNETTSIKK
jgi:hypothetical protein